MNMLVDWSLLLNLLRKRRSRSITCIARELNLNWQALARLARGDSTDPRFSTAITLLDHAADYLTPDDWAKVRRQSPLARARSTTAIAMRHA